MKRTRCRGFSLFEVTTGIALFAIAMFGISASINQSLSMSTFSKNRIIAMNDSRRVLEEIRKTAEDPGIGGGLAGITGTTDWSPFLVGGLDNEAVVVTIPNAGADPLQVQVLISWDEKGKTSNYVTNTLVTKRG